MPYTTFFSYRGTWTDPVTGASPSYNWRVAKGNSLSAGDFYTDHIYEKTAAHGVAIDGLTIKDGNIVLSGGQIAFPATANPSTGVNTLDDYEEGTWTPSFLSTGCSWTYTARNGTYTKVGRFVHCTYNIIASGGPTGTTTNTLYLSGLPYTVNGSSVSGYCALFAGLPQYPLLVQDSGYSYVQMRKSSDNSPMTGADAGTGYFYGVVTFLMAT